MADSGLDFGEGELGGYHEFVATGPGVDKAIFVDAEGTVWKGPRSAMGSTTGQVNEALLELLHP